MCWLRKQLSVAYYFLFGRIWTMNKWTTTTRSTEYIHLQWETSSLEKRLRVHIIPWITFFLVICMSYLFSIFPNTSFFHFAIIIFLLYLFWLGNKTIITFSPLQGCRMHSKTFASKITDISYLINVTFLYIYVWP